MCINLSLSLDYKAFGVKSWGLQVNSPNIYESQLSVKYHARYLVGIKNWASYKPHLSRNVQSHVGGRKSSQWFKEDCIHFKIKNYGCIRKESLILIVGGRLKIFRGCSVKREEWNQEGKLGSTGLGNVVTRGTSGRWGYNSWLSPNSNYPGRIR